MIEFRYKCFVFSARMLSGRVTGYLPSPSSRWVIEISLESSIPTGSCNETAGGGSKGNFPRNTLYRVTGHIVFLRPSHGSSQRDLSKWPASEVHRDGKERDRIPTRVGTGGIPGQGRKAS